jgi:DTW domain-containing protein YfiP
MADVEDKMAELTSKMTDLGDLSDPEKNEAEIWTSLLSVEPGLLELDKRDVRSQGFLTTRQPGDSVWSLQHSTPWQSDKLVLGADNPFKGLNISPTAPLNLHSDRQSCPVCSKSRKYFCYSCYVPVECLQQYVPHIRLPIKIDIVKHSREVDGKSTAVHAPIIANEDVRMYTFPDIPDYSSENALLVFPGKDSKSLDTILAECVGNPGVTLKESTTFYIDVSKEGEMLENQNFPYNKIVFIDSTWNQCKGMHRHPSLAGLPCVMISSRNTIFWRYQKGKPKEYLATIEAIYYFLVDFHQIVLKTEYKGEYDNMLFFFKFMYEKIHELYDHNKLRAYSRD